MKLFALAATTATASPQWHGNARRWPLPTRVTHPAPGWVNEQGGYWADQSSNQYQRPQQPQVSWQKPQCCTAIYQTFAGKHAGIWMEIAGENDMKPYYKGKYMTKEFFMFWKFNGGPSRRFDDLSGRWYLSDGLMNVTSPLGMTNESHSLRYCPTDHNQIWTNDVLVSCGQKPQQRDPPTPPPPQPCCEAIHWKTTSGEIVIFQKNGQENDGRPVYEHKSSGPSTFLYWEFDPSPISPDPRALSGHWKIGTSVDDPFAQIQSNQVASSGVNSCPADHSIVWGSFGDMQCDDAVPPELQTCENSWKDGPNNNIFFGDNVFPIATVPTDLPLPTDCNVERVMRNFVGSQFHQFWLFDGKHNPNATKLPNAFTQMILGWQQLSSDSSCFSTSYNEYLANEASTSALRFKTFPNCDQICSQIQDTKTGADLAGSLNAFADLVKLHFDGRTYKIYDS